MTRPHFCGVQAGPRPIFTIQACSAYSIEKFSFFQGLDSKYEVLFRPLSRFQVVHAQKNIIDPQETASLERSGFPDAVVLKQLPTETSPSQPSAASGANSTSTPSQVSQEKEVQALLSKLNVTDVNQADGSGWTPLMGACSKGDDQRARALIKAGAAVDATEEDGWTALMFAAQDNHERCGVCCCCSSLLLHHILFAVVRGDGPVWSLSPDDEECMPEQTGLQRVQVSSDASCDSRRRRVQGSLPQQTCACPRETPLARSALADLTETTCRSRASNS